MERGSAYLDGRESRCRTKVRVATKRISALAHRPADHPPMRTSCGYMSVLCGCCLRTRIRCKQRRSTIALLSSFIRLAMTRRRCCSSSSARPASAITRASSWKPQVGTTNSVTRLRSTRMSASSCCTSPAYISHTSPSHSYRSAAVTCAVLAPAGPNRSRILASLYRDERSAELPTFNVLSKMFLDHILRPAEIHEFEKTLKPHQVAKIAISSNDRLSAVADEDEDAGSADEPVSTRRGPSTVLDRAVMEHNLLASSKIYNNITFRGLGALLDLTPGAAETMARRMIEQGRLRGWIDQVDRLIWFEAREDEEAQGKAGGLGDVEEAEDTGSPFTKRWDMQIRTTAAHVSFFLTLS